MAEWPIASVLKTEVGQPTVGSNPTSSATFLFHVRWIFYFSIDIPILAKDNVLFQLLELQTVLHNFDLWVCFVSYESYQ